MSENMDPQPNNLCIPEDAFEQFQAVSMYQVEEYITLPEIPTKTKELDPGELTVLTYDNEVVVTTENEVNSTVNDNYSEDLEIEPEMQQTILDNSGSETTANLDDEVTDLDQGVNNLDHTDEPKKVNNRGRKKKIVIENESDVVCNNLMIIGSKECSTDVQVNTEPESSFVSSTVTRKRGRKPKPKLVPPESITPLETNQDSFNVSSTPFSSDPENANINTSVRRKRGRPRKEKTIQNDRDKEISSELSGSDNNRIDDLSSPRKRGRPKKIRPEINIDSQLTHDNKSPQKELTSLEDLNGTELATRDKRSRKSLELDTITNLEHNINPENKIICDYGFSENDELDDIITLSKLKTLPETIKSADENNLSETYEDHNSTNNSIENLDSLCSKKRNLAKKPKSGRYKKNITDRARKEKVEVQDDSNHVVTSLTSNNETHTESTLIVDDETEDLSLSKLKALKSDLGNTDNNNTADVSTTDDKDIVEVAETDDVNDTSSKRNSKMPVMLDFEYNVDSVIDKDIKEGEELGDNALLVEDTSKRPIRKKVPKLRYDEESDEDPFANVELSDDEPRMRKGNRYYSDDEYIPGRRGNKDIDSTDSELTESDLIDKTLVKQKRKKLRKRSENQSPQKKAKSEQSTQDVDSDDVELCLPPAIIKPGDDAQPQPSKAWGTSNEFENFLAKKIQGTNLKITKLSACEPIENKALEIPVIDPEAKKTYEMCSQTNITNTVSIGVQTSTPYDVPMKEKINLTSEQSEKACYFLNSIVKTTSELGTLMTQKSEDFIKKKINTTHVTDTMKMDYCVKKSFLLFKLAKHNLMQMEEDLAKQYDEFLKCNKLTECRELPKVIVPSAKPISSDSDCEIVEEPVNSTSVNKSKEKPKFNPKTVFLNKELSIKIAKKPTENKKLDIKGRHTVWINDTVMVKKVKPTQSFLAQDSRNKKPPDNIITTKMVSDFFKNYYRQKAISACAPFITTDWLSVGTECVCNYFVVEPIKLNNYDNYSANSEVRSENIASTSETNALKQIPNNKTMKCPDTLLTLCFRIVKNQMYDKRHVREVSQHIQNELADGKYQPVTLLRLCLRVMTGRAVNNMEKSPTPSKIIPPNDVSTIPPLKALCHRKIVALFYNSSKKDSIEEQDVAEIRCSTEACNSLSPICSSKYLSPSIERTNEIKSLFTLCVEFVQRKQVLELSNITILLPKSLKSFAYECVKKLMYSNINVPLLESSQLNLNQLNEGIMTEGLTINSVNTLSEEAFLNLKLSHADNPDSPEYLDDYDHGDHYEPDFNEIEQENQTETSWVSQVQMQELRSCFNTTNADINEGETISAITQIKIEPLDDLPENLDLLAHVKIEPIPAPDEMTMIPEVKPEVLDQVGPVPLERQSYNVDAFENFVAYNKMTQEHDEDIFSQSSHRVRRQHEPDYEEDDMSMSLLVPQTYEPLTIETAKGSLMESSSDDDSSKTKRVIGKKKSDKRNKGKQKKPEPKPINKETPVMTTKDKPTTNEVANLTKKMRDRIRQEEINNDSTDSETENIPLRLRNKKELEKSVPAAQTGKAKESEIQCNNVDSTDQVDDNVGNFTGFTAIDQNEISTYQKYMKYVYEKIIPNKEDESSKINKATEEKGSQKPIIADEPIELLECEPTIPIFDVPISERRTSRKSKSKFQISNIEENAKKEEKSNREVNIKKEEIINESVPKVVSFIDRHGWHCYPVNSEDEKLYQSSCVALEKLPESFVQTYFEYQGISSTNVEDQEIDRLTNLNSLNRTVQLQSILNKKKSKREVKGDRTSEAGSQPDSPTYSDHYDELEPSDDERANIDDEVAPPLAQKHTENTLAKNLLMDENDSDSDGTGVKIKQEPSEGTEAFNNKLSSKSKKKEDSALQETGDLMLTADKMMNKELTLLHAPVVVTDDVQNTPSKGPVTRNKQKNTSKNQSLSSKLKYDEEYSSEEEKQWVTTKEKLLKRMGKKDHASLDDAKRAKLVSEFIERRGGFADSHMRSRSSRSRRSGKKLLERQKQLGILSRELFGESSDSYMSKRSQAQANVYKGRRNIRKVIDKKSLARSTVVANMEEFERKRRLNARQTKLRELLGCEEGVNVLVINDEVCLEYDFEENRPVVTVHPFFTKVMKAHQYEGVKFMWDACFESLAEIEAGRPGGGCILAHCMGLGKTLQVLALLHTVLTHPGVKMQRVLVCCPLSTVLNWVDEIHKWIGPVTNQIKVFELSKLKKTYERAYQLEDWYSGGGIFIIGYELFRSLSTLDPFLDDVRPTIVNKIRTALLDPGPDIIVCDEGHLLKNDCSVLAVAMSRVVTKRRIILTGTPMQNNLREYYCMVNFVKPNLLGTYSEYSNRFENPIMNGQHRDSREEDIKLMKARTHILHKVLEGCLQRQEASVLYPYLPKKHEYTVFITLTPCQWDLYKHYLNNYAKQSKQSILKDFHILQKIWSHPQVLHNFQTKVRDRDEKNKIKAEKLEDDLATEDLEEIKPNAAVDLWWLEYLDGGNMLETLDSSNKFVVVFRILDECIALGDKVLIFSTSLFCLDALEYFLKKIKNWSLGNEYYRLDGSVPAEVRQKWCREYNADNNYKTKLFLVSTRAGCLGLNMTAANRVIIMDTSWNPAHDIQSIFRVYRFGQKKDCYIYRLVAMGTMEQKIYERSVTKQAVACRVVDEQQIDRHYNMAELTELYKFDEGGSCVAGGVAVGVRDVALLRVARDVLLHAVHEHDSLLRGSGEQGLPEHERNAAWMQFQQEQAHKQIENKLVVNIPKVSLKRIHGHDYTQESTADIDIKVEKEDDTSSDFNPNEPKSKKGKKAAIVKCCIPIQDVNEQTQTRSKSKKEPDITRPGTSKQNNDNVPPDTPIDNSKSLSTISQEEIMVEKITDILLKYNFQGKKGKTDISDLVKKVRNMVKKGYVDDEDNSDDLTASIAKVLLPQQMTLPKVTNIMCESINNSAAPNATTSDYDPGLIISDPTPSTSKLSQKVTPTEPELRSKRKAAIAAVKNMDSLAHDVVINIDDDDWDRDTDFVPGEDDNLHGINNKAKKKSKNLNPSKVVDTDESTLSADEVSNKYVMTHVDNFSDKVKKVTNNDPTKTKGPTKPKDRVIKTYTRQEKKEIPSNKPIENVQKKDVNKNVEKDYSSILLSDEDEPTLSLANTDKLVKTIAKIPVESSNNDEIVPLPMSLLKNQNFINIVAHTYLVGNPMLDEDAATLAAQYSTLKALKEAELTGKEVSSGPIYDIAVKVIGQDILKKMRSVNPKANTSVNDANTSLQMKEQMIASQKTFEETAKSSKAKLRESMIKEKLALHKTLTESRAPATVKTPAVSINNTVVPVGLIKTTTCKKTTQMYSQSLVTPQRTEPRVECILPDDDDVIISDVRASPAPPLLSAHTTPAPPPTSAPPLRPATPNSTKPTILNHMMYKPTKQGYETQPFRVTVGKTGSVPQKVTPSKINFKPNQPRPVSIPQIKMETGKAGSAPVKVTVHVPTKPAPETILPNNYTICLDSDEEETITPNLRHSTSNTNKVATMAKQQAPVPVSLTSAHTLVPVSLSNPYAPVPVSLTTANGPVPVSLVSLSNAHVPGPVSLTSAHAPVPVSLSSAYAPVPVSFSSAPVPVSLSSAQPPIYFSSVNAPVPVSLTSAQAPGVKLALPPKLNVISGNQDNTPQQTLVLRQVVTTDGVQAKYVLIPTDKLPIPILPKPPVAEPPLPTPPPPTPPLQPLQQIKTCNTETSEPVVSTKKSDSPMKKATCKPGDILRISKTGDIEVINRIEKKNTSSKAAPKSAKTRSAPSPLRTIAPKPKTSTSTSIDLTNMPSEMPKQASKPFHSASVDLTNVAADFPKSKLIAPKPSTSVSIDLSNSPFEVVKPKKATSHTVDANKNQKKVEDSKIRKISSSSASASSRSSSPDNPLAILKDVVHIKAVDYPTSSTESNTSLIQRTDKCRTSNISVQHVVAADFKAENASTSGLIKLTKVPKDKVPKYIDEAVEKKIKKDALLKKITPLLSNSRPKFKEESKNRGKNTINVDNLITQTSKAFKNTGADKSSVKKGTKKIDSKILKAPETVDLTNVMLPEKNIKTNSGIKIERTKRQSSSTEASSIKKKKKEPMTLKDFNLDDIDDIIELE